MRSFRRNLASSSSKPPPAEPRHGAGGKGDGSGSGSIYKGRFVKINMDGVPIGRKVDLKAHGSYGKLAAAVDHLFQGLLAGTYARKSALPRAKLRACVRFGRSLVNVALSTACAAAQRDESSCAAGEKPAAITGLLDGSGEYTLVYEDDEGDQMLVGDVPWE